jgi:hypothetical protein
MTLMFIVFSSCDSIAQMELEVGQGRVRVIDPEWPLSESKRREVEAQLLTDPDWVPLVSAKEIKIFSLRESVSHDLEEKVGQGLESFADGLRKQVRELEESQTFVTKDIGETGMVIVDDLTGARVIMGASHVVQKQESLEELMIIGGRVEVFGKIESVVVIGGHLTLREGSEVRKELVVIGGYVDEEAGALVRGKRVDLSMPGGDEAWQILREKLHTRFFKDFTDQSWVRVTGLILKILIMMGCLWIGNFFAPQFQVRVREYLKNHLGRSAAYGFISVLLVLPVSLILTLSLVGIPLLPLQFSLLFLFVIYGQLHIGHWMTAWLPPLSQRPALATFFGILILEVTGTLLQLPWLKWGFVLIGFGAASKVFYSGLLSKRSLSGS